MPYFLRMVRNSDSKLQYTEESFEYTNFRLLIHKLSLGVLLCKKIIVVHMILYFVHIILYFVYMNIYYITNFGLDLGGYPCFLQQNSV